MNLNNSFQLDSVNNNMSVHQKGGRQTSGFNSSLMTPQRKGALRSSMKSAQKRNFSAFRTAGSALRNDNETLTNLDVFQNNATPLGAMSRK